jgi:hypothetical protein
MDTMIGLRKVTDDNAIGDDDSVFELKFTKARDFYGRDAEPLLLRLSMVDGQVSWAHETARNIRDEQILQMSNDGMRQADIAKEFNISKGRVNQILQKMKKDAVIVAKAPLTRDRPKNIGRIGGLTDNTAIPRLRSPRPSPANEAG